MNLSFIDVNPLVIFNKHENLFSIDMEDIECDFQCKIPETVTLRDINNDKQIVFERIESSHNAWYESLDKKYKLFIATE
jgi:hypothetical protein